MDRKQRQNVARRKSIAPAKGEMSSCDELTQGLVYKAIGLAYHAGTGVFTAQIRKLEQVF